MLTISALASAALLLVKASSCLFRYLRYRDHLKTVRYLCDKHGVGAMRDYLKHSGTGVAVTGSALNSVRRLRQWTGLSAQKRR